MSISTQRFRCKYRISSNRLKEWDYGSAAYNFITTCTKHRIHWFGEITGGIVTQSNPGKIVTQELENTSRVRTNVSLDAYIVMPNHLHAIIVIDEASEVETPRRGVSTVKNWRPGVLGAIINQPKSVCTKRIHSIGYTDFAWQSRFYDHIIHKESELENIRAYILGNPIKWADDDYYSIDTQQGSACSKLVEPQIKRIVH